MNTKDRRRRQRDASYRRSSLTGLPSTIFQKNQIDGIFVAWMLLTLWFATSFSNLYQSGFTYWMKGSKSRSCWSNLKQRPCNMACWDVFTHDMSSSHLTPPHHPSVIPVGGWNRSTSCKVAGPWSPPRLVPRVYKVQEFEVWSLSQSPPLPTATRLHSPCTGL